jgi:hypothetical protein
MDHYDDTRGRFEQWKGEKMLPVLLILFFLLLFVLPAIIWLYFYFSKYCACPFCGEKILKTERKCPKCNSDLQALDTLDKKALNVAHAYRDGAKQFLYDGETSSVFENTLESRDGSHRDPEDFEKKK